MAAPQTTARDQLRGALFVLAWLALALLARANWCGDRAAPTESDFGPRGARTVAAR